MYVGRIITVRATVGGKKRVRKLGPGGQVDLTAARDFARRVSRDHATTAYLQAEAPMGSEALLVAAFTDGKAVQE